MTRSNSGAGEDRGSGGKQTADQQRGVNERSLLILKLLQKLAVAYPKTADVGEFAGRLHAEDDRSWDWLADLGLIGGDPDSACLTATGRQVFDEAASNALFRETVETLDEVPFGGDQHAAAVLALLYANYEQRYAIPPKK